MTDFDDYSHKRFKRKGFKRHVVKPHEVEQPVMPNEWSNKQKMQYKKQVREDRLNAKKQKAA